MSVDHGPARKPVEGATPSEPRRSTRNHRWGFGECPECMEEFVLGHPSQLFCCNRHRDDWRVRETNRGRQVSALDMVARITRDGTRGSAEDRELGREAARLARTLRQRWKDEDREAGRMPWTLYLRRRLAIGFDPLTS